MTSNAVRVAQEKLIADTASAELLDQCINRLLPILSMEQRRPRMSIPVDHERDDDVFVIERLREIKRRLSSEPQFPPWDGKCYFCGGHHGGLPCPTVVPMSSEDSRT